MSNEYNSTGVKKVKEKKKKWYDKLDYHIAVFTAIMPVNALIVEFFVNLFKNQHFKFIQWVNGDLYEKKNKFDWYF